MVLGVWGVVMVEGGAGQGRLPACLLLATATGGLGEGRGEAAQC